MRRSQLKWIPKEIAAGGTVWILAGIGMKVYVISGVNVKLINNRTEEEIAAIAVGVLNRRNNQRAAEILEEIFTVPEGE